MLIAEAIRYCIVPTIAIAIIIATLYSTIIITASYPSYPNVIIIKFPILHVYSYYINQFKQKVASS